MGSAGWTTAIKRCSSTIASTCGWWIPRGVAAPRRLTGGVGRARSMTFPRGEPRPRGARHRSGAAGAAVGVQRRHQGVGWFRDQLQRFHARVDLMATASFGGLTKARDAEQLHGHAAPTIASSPTCGRAARSRRSRRSPTPCRSTRVPARQRALHSWLNSDGDPLAKVCSTRPRGSIRRSSTRWSCTSTRTLRQPAQLHPSGRAATSINPVVYNSLGYMVFMPDIHYTDGYPGRAR
jgi:hypothetical protein